MKTEQGIEEQVTSEKVLAQPAVVKLLLEPQKQNAQLDLRYVGNESTGYYEYLGTDPEEAEDVARRQGLDMRDGDEAATHFRNTAAQRREWEAWKRGKDEDDE